MNNVYLNAAVTLHRYVLERHWSDAGLVGPDPGIRFNYRLGRFLKSYLRHEPRRDNLYYLQAQGYWTLGNWALFDRCGESLYRDVAMRCSETMLEHQRDDGAWEYPNREWKGRIATAEGTWGAIGLVESFRQTGDRRFLEGALRWHRFLVETIGFRVGGDTLAVNYFAGRDGGSVPNNSAFVLRFLAELADVTGDEQYCEPCPGMVRFVESVQLPSGELPYVAAGPGQQGREHFQCFQYNAFQCLDLMRYFRLTGQSPGRLVERLVEFLRGGLSPEGYAYYECGVHYRTVVYHTAVLAAALREAARLGIGECEQAARRAAEYVVTRQRPDGSFPYSRGDYRLLRDNRSYPRYLAMILVHLLMQQDAEEPAKAKNEPAGVNP